MFLVGKSALLFSQREPPFTDMARHTFGGDPRYLSVIDHLYNTFYHKISGTSFEQWIPIQVQDCRQLIHDVLEDGAIHET